MMPYTFRFFGSVELNDPVFVDQWSESDTELLPLVDDILSRMARLADEGVT